MKRIIFPVLIIFIELIAYGQNPGEKSLEMLEQGNNLQQNNGLIATVKSSTRLFGTKDDLTTVILIIPSGSEVTVLGSDSTYLNVVFDENEGYIFKRHAIIENTAVQVKPAPVPDRYTGEKQSFQEGAQQRDSRQATRFSYLESKYGTSMAARIISGKIWKGMNAEMVKDSWGQAEKITREISGNTVKEEWIYRNTWLYLENNTLIGWGAYRK